MVGSGPYTASVWLRVYEGRQRRTRGIDFANRWIGPKIHTEPPGAGDLWNQVTVGKRRLMTGAKSGPADVSRNIGFESGEARGDPLARPSGDLGLVGAEPGAQFVEDAQIIDGMHVATNRRCNRPNPEAICACGRQQRRLGIGLLQPLEDSRGLYQWFPIHLENRNQSLGIHRQELRAAVFPLR